MDKEEEVREKVRAGQYEEAIALARDHLGDDKRVLLVMLEYIAYEKKKAEKKAYMENVSIEDVRWSTGTSGITEVSGRLVNRGNKIITGIGLYIACVRQGLPGKKKFDRVTLRVSPFSSEEIRGILKGSENCENIEIRIVDLGTEDPPLVRQP